MPGPLLNLPLPFLGDVDFVLGEACPSGDPWPNQTGRKSRGPGGAEPAAWTLPGRAGMCVWQGGVDARGGQEGGFGPRGHRGVSGRES